MEDRQNAGQRAEQQDDYEEEGTDAGGDEEERGDEGEWVRVEERRGQPMEK